MRVVSSGMVPTSPFQHNPAQRTVGGGKACPQGPERGQPSCRRPAGWGPNHRRTAMRPPVRPLPWTHAERRHACSMRLSNGAIACARAWGGVAEYPGSPSWESRGVQASPAANTAYAGASSVRYQAPQCILYSVAPAGGASPRTELHGGACCCTDRARACTGIRALSVAGALSSSGERNVHDLHRLPRKHTPWQHETKSEDGLRGTELSAGVQRTGVDLPSFTPRSTLRRGQLPQGWGPGCPLGRRTWVRQPSPEPPPSTRGAAGSRPPVPGPRL